MIVDIDLAPITVLIIDDSRYARSFVKSALMSFGVRSTLEAADGADAFEILQGGAPVGLIIVDHDMAPMDGVEFTRLLRAGQVPAMVEAPVIMLSGMAEKDKVVEARSAGVTEFLAKPVSATSLYRRVRNALVNPRPFVRSATYVGPCRRTVDRPPADGQERRVAPPLPKPKPLIEGPRGNAQPTVRRARAQAAQQAPQPGDQTSRKRFKAGTLIFREGDEGNEAYVVETGDVAIFKELDGRRTVLGHLGPHGIFGEMALIDGAPRMASAEATQDTVCLVIPKPALTAQISRTPDLVILVLETLLQDVRRMGHELAQVRAKLKERRGG
ncbi:MAG: cyclic nucleotide-binding domain-containing protein [Solirubrobacterales bacterium]